MSKHTLTPWCVEQSGAYDVIAAYTEDGYFQLAKILTPPNCKSPDQAAFIVRAVNAHEDLVGMLEWLLETFTDGRSEMTRGSMDELAGHIRAELATARGAGSEDKKETD